MSIDIYTMKEMQYGIAPLPENPVVAMAYVPYQNPEQIYGPEEGINAGTMFPELDKPFLGSGGGNLE